MVGDSTFRTAIVFLEKLGIYDVVLPFLLSFTIVFAILEKTTVLGTEDIDGKKYTKKNLNAMVAFVLAFLVVLSSQIVSLINEAMAHIVILIFISVFFMMLVGSFHKEGEDFWLKGKTKVTFVVLAGIGIALIFLDAAKTSSGQSWLEYFWEDILTKNWGAEWMAALVLVLFIVLFMGFVTKGEKPKDEKLAEE